MEIESWKLQEWAKNIMRDLKQRESPENGD